MTNRIAGRMAELQANGGKSLSVVLMLGDPDFAATRELVGIAVNEGLDIVELGIPIAQPYLDSAGMQASMQRALAGCAELPRYLDAIAQIRSDFPALPLEVMVYHATVLELGLAQFCAGLADAGADAVLVADVAGQSAQFRAALDAELAPRDIYAIRFVPHPFNPGQIPDLREHAQGFVVVQTQADAAGRRPRVLEGNRETLAELRRAGVRRPLVLAYGIRTPGDVEQCLALGADGVLIGTVVLDAAHDLARGEFGRLLAGLRAAARGVAR
jgi:tryptophan synthase alpha chain